MIIRRTEGQHTAAYALLNVRFGSKADLCNLPTRIRFTPNSGHQRTKLECLLWAKTGLMWCSKTLFDHLVGAGEQFGRHGEAKRFGSI
jgi:hypothetical protein